MPNGNPPTAVALVHLDDHVAIVDKPSGIVVHRGWADDDGGLVERMQAQLGRRVWPVHRLDRGTSGLLIFALSADCARTLAAAFIDGGVHKRYIAITRGHPPETVLVDHPIPNRPDGPRVPAVTEIHRLATWERYALVAAFPATGRLHQIRRHLKHLSCPIIGDVNYGKGEHNRLFRERFGLQRLALHSIGLRLKHPVTAESLNLYAPPSGQLASCLEAMGLAAAVPGPDREV